MVGLHLSERLFHFAEDPNRFGHRIRRTIAFEPRDQPSLTLNASALVENISLADLDWRLGLRGRGWACHTNACSIQKFSQANAGHV